MKTIPTTRGISYAITCAAACSVTAADGSVLLNHAAGQLQSQFVAIDEEVTLSLDTAIIVPVFSHATGGLSSPSGAQSMPVVELGCSPAALELKSGVMYRLELDTEPDDIHFQNLSMESHADKVMTCELCIDANGYRSGHEIFWPLSWIWLDEQTAPDLSTGGLRYFAIRSDHGLSFIVEHSQYVVASASRVERL